MDSREEQPRNAWDGIFFIPAPNIISVNASQFSNAFLCTCFVLSGKCNFSKEAQPEKAYE